MVFVLLLALPGVSIDQSEASAKTTRLHSSRLQSSVDDDALVAALKPLGFLLGDWDAAPGPSGETGGFSFRSGAQGHILVRTNFANYPASADKPASRHDDLMVIAPDAGAICADYFDNEGHVIRYVARSINSGQVEFVSEIKPNEPRFRLRYTANRDDSLAGQFDIAPPGQPDTFSPYLSWTARRRAKP